MLKLLAQLEQLSLLGLKGLRIIVSLLRGTWTETGIFCW
jgi:hypothetical protein